MHELSRFAHGELDEFDMGELSSHLDQCAPCRHKIDSIFALEEAAVALKVGVDNRFLSEAQLHDALVALASGAHQTTKPQANGDAEQPEQIGHYRIVRLLGQGGMGQVYLADDQRLQRRVALKIIRAKGASTEEAKRFQVEAEAAAKLRHPHIVPLYEVGEEAGQRFLTMAYIEGVTLGEQVAAGPLPPREAARLVQQVAEAVHYAHTQGVIHRDLKPRNILVDPNGQAFVLDFGLAKRSDHDSELTHSGQVMGTPSFMPPEQAEGKNEQVGPLADVYALGATLYCLLTGRPPFQAASVVETLRLVIEREPVAPRALNPAVPRDLETICLKCLAKRPDKRYDSAQTLVADLQRFLEFRSIVARPVGPTEKVLRWYRRNPVLAGALTTTVVMFLVAFAFVSWSLVRVETALRDEAKLRKTADDAKDTANRNAKSERWERYRAGIAGALSAQQLDNWVALSTALKLAPEEHRNWEWQYLHTQLDNRTATMHDCLTFHPATKQIAMVEGKTVHVRSLNGTLLFSLTHEEVPQFAQFNHDGTLLAIGTADQVLHVWDTPTRRILANTSFPNVPRHARPLFFHPHQSEITFAMPPHDGMSPYWVCWRFRTATKPIPLRELGSPYDYPLWLSPKGDRVVGDHHHRTALFDTTTQQRVSEHKATMMTFSPDGRRYATLERGLIYIHDSETGRILVEFRGPDETTPFPAWSPDGRRLATSCFHPANTIHIWDTQTGKELAKLVGHDNSIRSVQFSPDGQRLVSASLDQTARLWDSTTGNVLAVLRGHRASVTLAHFSPNGERLITSAEEPGMRLWDGRTGQALALLTGEGIYQKGAFTPDGLHVWSADERGEMFFWEVALLERNGVLRGHTGYIYDVAFRPDGEEVASVAWDGTLRTWNATTGHAKQVLRRAEATYFRSVAYHPQGQRLTTVDFVPSTGKSHVTLWDVRQPKPLQSWSYPGDMEDFRASFTDAGNSIFAGINDGTLRWYQEGAAEATRTIAAHDAPPGPPSSRYPKCVSDATYAPDGQLFASCGYDHTVRLWDASTHTQRALLRGHTAIPTRILFSPKGTILASASTDTTVRIWDVASHELLATLEHGSAVYGISFTPDGTRLASGCADTSIRLWDIATFSQVAELRGHSDYVHAVAFSSDGSRLVSGSGDKTVRIWDTRSTRDRAARRK